AAGSGIRHRTQFFERSVETGTEDILFALWEAIEEPPEEIEVGTARIVNAMIAADYAPYLLDQCPDGSCGDDGAQMCERSKCAEDALDSFARIRGKQVQAFADLLRDRGRDRPGSVGSSKGVQFCESEATPLSTEHTKPRDAVLRIEEPTGEGDSIDDFRAVAQAFQFNGAEGNSCFTQGQCDWRKCRACASQNRDSILPARDPGYLDAINMAANQCNDVAEL